MGKYLSYSLIGIILCLGLSVFSLEYIYGQDESQLKQLTIQTGSEFCLISENYSEFNIVRMDTKPINVKGRNMVPVRWAELLGFTVEWNKETKIATLTRDLYEISIPSGKNFMTVDKGNGEIIDITLDSPSFVNEQGRMFIPIAAFARAIGFEVQWDSYSEIASINSDKEQFEKVMINKYLDERTQYIVKEVKEVKEPVVFMDKGMEKLVRDQLARPSGAIYSSELAKITKLNSDAASIESLEDLRYFENLTELSLNNENLVSLKPILYPRNLININLYKCDLDDIRALKRCPKLQTVNLSSNSIVSIDALAGHQVLSVINLVDNNIKDISALKEMDSLYYLYLSNNYISDISSVSNLKNIYSLYLDNNLIEKVADFTQEGTMYEQVFSRLTILNLNNNRISDISFIKNMKQLVELDLSQNQLSSIEALGELTELKVLNLYNNKINNISDLKKLTKLTNLLITANPLIDVSSLNEIAKTNPEISAEMKFLKKSNEVLTSIIKPTMTNTEKAKAIYVWLIKNITYDKEVYASKSPVRESGTIVGGLLNGKAVCGGYANTAQLLLNSCGIECGVKYTYNHWINVINLDGKYTFFDATRGDLYSSSTKINYSYFNISHERALSIYSKIYIPEVLPSPPNENNHKLSRFYFVRDARVNQTYSQ